MWPHSLFAGLLLLALTHHQTHAVHLIADCPAPIPVLDTRLDLPKLAEKEGFLRGAELGVLHGSFSKEVLEVWPSAIEYWLVDLWAHQENYDDVANLENSGQEDNFQTTLANTRPWADKIRICRNFTTVCAKRIQDGYFDYVYVDARHDRKGVLMDLEAWWPKVRSGGILAGHDFTTQELWGYGPGEHQNWTINFDGSVDVSGRVVRGAVEDFAKRKQRQIQLTYKDGAGLPSWAIRK